MGIKKKENNVNNFNENLNSKGFLLANFDKLLTWARTGSFAVNDIWSCMKKCF